MIRINELNMNKVILLLSFCSYGYLKASDSRLDSLSIDPAPDLSTIQEEQEPHPSGRLLSRERIVSPSFEVKKRLPFEKEVSWLKQVTQTVTRPKPNSVYLSGNNMLVLPWESNLYRKGVLIGKVSYELTIYTREDQLVSYKAKILPSFYQQPKEQLEEQDIQDYCWKQFVPVFLDAYYAWLCSEEQNCIEKSGLYKDSFKAYIEQQKGYPAFVDRAGSEITRELMESSGTIKTFDTSFSSACKKKWQEIEKKANDWKYTFTWRTTRMLEIFAGLERPRHPSDSTINWFLLTQKKPRV